MDFNTVQNRLRQMGITTNMIKRGYELYKGNAIREYKYTMDSNYFLIRIEAKVQGTRMYEEIMTFGFLGGELELRHSRCTCPFHAYEVCKHNSAILIKFLMENFAEVQEKYNVLYEEKKKKETYNDFRIFVNKLDYASEKTKIKYKLKGLDKMVNFKIFLDFEKNSEPVQENFFKNMFNEYYDFSTYLSYLSEEDYSFIKLIKTIRPKVSSKDYSLTIPKDKNSVLILKEFMKKGKLFTEKNEKISYGGLIKPTILIDGNDEYIEFKVLNKPENLYIANDAAWILEDNCFYDYESSIYNFEKKIYIPQEELGNFLFVQLKKIKKEFDAELSEYFQNLKLVINEPKIKFILDYKDEYIVFENHISFNGKTYRNDEISRNIESSLHNKIQRVNENTWEKVDLSSLTKLFEIINKYKFYGYGEGFAIKDKNEIQRFLTLGIPHFPEEWELVKSESFESLKIEELELEPIVEFVQNGDKIDWFEFTVKYLIEGVYYSKKELDKLIEYNENGEAFIKIGNKYFLLKETEAENKVKNMTKNSEMDKKGNYQSSYFNMIYYRNLIKNSGINFLGNQIFDELDRDISDMSIIENLEVPKEVEGILRPYQKEGYKWLNFLNKFRFGGILADDMGLGKTLQALSFLKSIERPNPSLIVVPKSLVYNWKNETQKFFPDLTLMVYDGSLQQRKSRIEDMKNFDLVVTSFDMASRDHEELRDIKFLYLILDEAHNIKNRTTKRTGNIKKIKSSHRLALTGTPLENSLEELWSIFDFVIPGYLGTFKSFNDNYVKVTDNKERAFAELKNKIAPFMLRRKKEDVLKELPDKIENIISVEMNEEQNIAYNLILDKVKADLESLVSSRGFNSSQITILAALTKLRQICNHPNLVFEDNEKVYESAKLEALVELVKESIYSGHKILVFSQFVQMLKLIKEKLIEEDIEFEYLDGSTKNRMERVNSFNENEDIKVFLLSLKAGGTGLNLTSADIVIHVDPWWNPQIERQATDRAHRMGQDKKVMVYKLITKGTVEEKMLKLQERKKEVFDAVIDSSSGNLGKVTWNDIQELLSLE